MTTFRKKQKEVKRDFKSSIRLPEKLASVVLGNIDEGILLLSRDFRIIWANKKIRKLTHLKEAEIIGDFCYKITHYRDEKCQPPYDICPVEEVLKTGKPIKVVHTHLDKDSNKFYVEVSAYPVKDKKGKINQFVHISRDVTNRVKAEKRLEKALEINRKRTAKLRKAYKNLQEMKDMLIQAEKLNAIGHLASGVAHEVKNPLGIIAQGVSYLEKKKHHKQKDTLKALSMIKDSVNRADKIICLLLNFSKATRLDLHPENINHILDDSLTLVKDRHKCKNINIIKEIKKNIPLVLIDKYRMEQVFINLLLNAIQAMPKGGDIIIRSFDKQLKGARKDVGRRAGDLFRIGERAVIVEIEDTGIGISEKDLKKIFDPFFTTKASQGGTGLGLSVSLNIIAVHRGLIDIKSQAGRGTKVTITLKIAKRGR